MAYTAKDIERLEQEEQRRNAAVILQTLPRLLHFWIMPGSAGGLSAFTVNDEVIHYDFAEEKAGITTFGDVIYLGVRRVKGLAMAAPLPARYRSLEAWELHSSQQLKPATLAPVPAAVAPAVVREAFGQGAATPGLTVLLERGLPIQPVFGMVREAAVPAKPVQLDSPINSILAKKDEVIQTQSKTIEVLKEAVDDLKVKVTRPASPPVTQAPLPPGYGQMPPARPALTADQRTTVKRYLGFLSSWCTAMGFSTAEIPMLATSAVYPKCTRSTDVPMSLWKVYVNFCKSKDLRATDEGLVLQFRGTNYPLPLLPDTIRIIYKDYSPESFETELYKLGKLLF